MAPAKAKTIVYRFNQDAKSGEEDFDPSGEFAASAKH
jgi:hypothetical protein